MDFHTLTRRQLQALCKKNKIPANITNLAMADALQALPTVEGIEEIMLQEPVGSSIETPAKALVGSSVNVPRTGPTTRRKTAARAVVKEDESENLHTGIGRTRRSTRKPVAGEDNIPHTPAPIASACRKMDMETQFNEIEREEKEKKSIRKGREPTIVAASSQRGLHSYSTRRSARLAVKNMEDFVAGKDEEGSKPLDTDLFPVESAEIKELNEQQEEECPVSATESSAVVDSEEKSGLGLQESNELEILSGIKSDCSAENHNNFAIECDGDRSETIEVGDSKMTMECDEGGEEKRYGSEKLYSDMKEDAFEAGKVCDINEDMGCNESAAAAEDAVRGIENDDDVSFDTEDGTDLEIKSGVEQNTNVEMGCNDSAAAAENATQVIENENVLFESEEGEVMMSDENRKTLNEIKEMEMGDDDAAAGADPSLVDDLDVLNMDEGGVVEEINESGQEEVEEASMGAASVYGPAEKSIAASIELNSTTTPVYYSGSESEMSSEESDEESMDAASEDSLAEKSIASLMEMNRSTIPVSYSDSESETSSEESEEEESMDSASEDGLAEKSDASYSGSESETSSEESEEDEPMDADSEDGLAEKSIASSMELNRTSIPVPNDEYNDKLASYSALESESSCKEAAAAADFEVKAYGGVSGGSYKNVANLEEELMKNIDALLIHDDSLPLQPQLITANEQHSSSNAAVAPPTTTPMKEEGGTARKTKSTAAATSLKKTPRKAAADALVSDKENMMTAEQQEELQGVSKQQGVVKCEKPFEERSLRQLRKMLKEKLHITTKLNNINDNDTDSSPTKVAAAAAAAASETGRQRRVALQSLPSDNQQPPEY